MISIKLIKSLLLLSTLLSLMTLSVGNIHAAEESITTAASSESVSSSSTSVNCNFNGDLYEDLAVGVPGEDIGSMSNAGAVNVLYGSASGLQTTSPADQFWHQNSPGVGNIAEEGDLFGGYLACGYFNGDGYGDLAIGVPGEDIGSLVNAGAVNVLYGSSSGLTSTGDQFWHQNSPGVDNTAEEADFFGNSLAAGDFNNDGYSDLAVGVFSEDIGSTSGGGAVNVLYGSSSGLTSTGDEFWHQDSLGVNDSAEQFDFFAISLAAGDFNLDGFNDLAIGVEAEDIGIMSDAGAVNVLYGSSSGLQTTSPADQFWHQDILGVDNAAEDLDAFGNSLAAGDFNNDGYSDLAIGVYREGIGTISFAGAVNVLYGSSSGLQTSSPADQFWHQDSISVNDAAEADDSFGGSLATGDFNLDGYGDLAIGVSGEDIDSISNAGAVNVLYGSSSGLTSAGDQFWHQDSISVNDAAEAGDFFAISLASGDFNNDGYGDLAVGVFFEDIGTVSDAGAVNVLYGSSSGLQTTSPADQFWHQDSPGVNDSAEISDNFGSSLA